MTTRLLNEGLAALRWAKNGEFSARVTPEQAQALIDERCAMLAEINALREQLRLGRLASAKPLAPPENASNRGSQFPRPVMADKK